MFKRFGIATLVLGSVLALAPASGVARDRDDFYRSNNAYGYSRNEYVTREYRERARREQRDRRYNQRWERGRNDRYDNQYGRYEMPEKFR